MTRLSDTLDRLVEFVTDNPRLTVLTGAGISADSGIPTYRDNAGSWQHSTPITHQEYIAEPRRRQRYWARSMQGWPLIRDARPNVAHRVLSRLEQWGYIELIITQNVDRLHQRAGSVKVIDLHGRVDQVNCLDCDWTCSREHIQQQLVRQTPTANAVVHNARPDGDADVSEEQIAAITSPRCEQCGGVLMPDVVFFGGSVPKARVEQCSEAVTAADALLVVGSSLQVFSGFRFCRLAKQLGKPLAVINPGVTRADSIADLKLSTPCGPLLDALLVRLATERDQATTCAAGSPN
ncbi:MAG: NAD-dependent protein deacetylase [Pseudomonadota bacterium]